MLLIVPLTNGSMCHHTLSTMEHVDYTYALVDGADKFADYPNVYDLRKPKGFGKILWGISMVRAYKIVQKAHAKGIKNIFFINGEFLPLVWFITLFARWYGMNVVTCWHDVTPHVGSVKNYFMWLLALVGACCATHIMVHSLHYRLHLKKWLFFKHIAYVPMPPCGFLHRQQCVSKPLKVVEDLLKGRQYFIFTGSLQPYKGVHKLIPIFREHPTLTLLIVGSGDKRYMRQLQQAVAGSENIIFYPHLLADEHFMHYLRGAKALMMPYLHASQSLLPYLAAVQKIPIIATKNTGITKTVTDLGGHIYDVNDVQSLRTLITGDLRPAHYILSEHEADFKRHLSLLNIKIKA